MEELAVFFGLSINWIILFLVLFTIGGFAYTVLRVEKLKNSMDEERRKSGGRKEYTEGGIKKEADVYTWEDVLVNLEKFNKIRLSYSMFEQFVPVFPLLGILGTVAGLIKQLGNVDQMREALSLSMSTTFWGLIAAIGLKLIDAIFVKKSVSGMSMQFDLFEQNYQMVKDKHIQEEENNRG